MSVNKKLTLKEQVKQLESDNHQLMTEREAMRSLLRRYNAVIRGLERENERLQNDIKAPHLKQDKELMGTETHLSRPSKEGVEALNLILTRIGSWTPQRWDQHIRYKVGDDIADNLIDFMVGLGIEHPNPYKRKNEKT